MTRFLRDSRATADAIAAMEADVRFAEYELAVALGMAHGLGMSWAELGAARGTTGQATGRWARRHLPDAGTDVPFEERERIGRRIGVGDRVDRFALEVIVSGRPGISRCEVEPLDGTHLSAEVAHRRATREAARRGKRIRVWRVEPDGRREAWTLVSTERGVDGPRC